MAETFSLFRRYFLLFSLASAWGCARSAEPLHLPTADRATDFAQALLSQFDRDGNRALDRDEFANATVEIFCALDKNDDLKLTLEEAGHYWGEHAFEADKNHDRKLSLSEALDDQALQFERFDRNSDGLLDENELRDLAVEGLAAKKPR